MGGGHHKPLMQMLIFFLWFLRRFDPTFTSATAGTHLQRGLTFKILTAIWQTVSVEHKRKHVLLFIEAPKNSSLTLFRNSGERGSHETNMMTSPFKNERAGPDGTNMCSRRATLRRVTTLPTVCFATQYCCFSPLKLGFQHRKWGQKLQHGDLFRHKEEKKPEVKSDWWSAESRSHLHKHSLLVFYQRSAFTPHCHLSPASDGLSRRPEKTAARAELIVILAVLLGP